MTASRAPLRSTTLNFDGSTLVSQDTRYNAMGQVASVTRPYFLSGPAVYTPYGTPSTTTSYDILNRVLTATAPDGSISRMSYNGLTTQTTNALNQTSTQLKNSQDQLIRSTDAMGKSNTYRYDPFGNLIETIDAVGNSTRMSYDIRGRKLSMDDPDMGHWTYRYNVLGELIAQTDARNQETTFEYDLLGRMTRRTEPEGTSTAISTWGYDGTSMGIGKPHIISAPGGYLRTHSYDSLGRLSRTETRIGGLPYAQSTAYDSAGRVATTVYPTGFTIRNVYNAQGFLSEVRQPHDNSLYWRADHQNADSQVTQSTLGNGLTTVRSYDAATARIEAISTGLGSQNTVQDLHYVYDTLGNLTQRSDTRQNLTESFAYDPLNRLLQARLNATGSPGFTKHPGSKLRQHRQHHLQNRRRLLPLWGRPAAGTRVNSYLAAAVAGGIGSVLGGGKFANGAVTGTFAYAAGRVATASTRAAHATAASMFAGGKYGYAIEPDFMDGDGIPGDVQAKISAIKPVLTEALKVATLRHATAAEVEEIARLNGGSVRDVKAFVRDTIINVPPGMGLSVTILTHEITHVYQGLTVPDFGRAYGDETQRHINLGNSPKDAYLKNDFEVDARSFARDVERAYWK